MSTNVQPTAFVGIDWGSAFHQVCVHSSEGELLGEKEFPHSGEGLSQMVDWILARADCDPAQISVSIEVPHGAIVDTMMDRNFPMFSINPKQLDRFRDRFSPAGAKDDRRDARVLASALRTDPQCFRKLDSLDPEIIQLRELSRMWDELTRERTRFIHRFREQLQRYFPQFLQLGGNLYDAWLLELWLLVSTPERARRVRLSSIAKVMKKHRIRRLTPEEVLQILKRRPVHAAPGVVEAATRRIQTLIKYLTLTQDSLKKVKREIEAILEPMMAPVEVSPAAETTDAQGTTLVQKRYSDAQILASIPGIGPTVLATFLSEAYHLIAYRKYLELRCLCGTAPVTKRSGKMLRVTQRKACSERLREATYHWGRVAVQRDHISKAKYQALRARGHTHGRALRSIGDRLFKVACAMLRDGTLFDPTRKSAAPEIAA